MSNLQKEAPASAAHSRPGCQDPRAGRCAADGASHAAHIYAQVFDAAGANVLAAASTVQEAVRKDLKGTGNVDAAKAVGRAIAERAKAAGISKVAFDRSGFMYHGRVKALADAAREAGTRVLTQAGSQMARLKRKDQPATSSSRSSWR
jgi:large subunit ribosomal protein L18